MGSLITLRIGEILVILIKVLYTWNYVSNEETISLTLEDLVANENSLIYNSMETKYISLQNRLNEALFHSLARSSAGRVVVKSGWLRRICSCILLYCYSSEVDFKVFLLNYR